MTAARHATAPIPRPRSRLYATLRFGPTRPPGAKLALLAAPVRPRIDTLPVRIPGAKLALVAAPVRSRCNALPVRLPVAKLTLVALPVRPRQDPSTVRQPIPTPPLVAHAVRPRQNASPVPLPGSETALVALPVRPRCNALPVFLPGAKLALVAHAVRERQDPSTVRLPIADLAFVVGTPHRRLAFSAPITLDDYGIALAGTRHGNRRDRHPRRRQGHRQNPFHRSPSLGCRELTLSRTQPARQPATDSRAPARPRRRRVCAIATVAPGARHGVSRPRRRRDG